MSNLAQDGSAGAGAMICERDGFRKAPHRIGIGAFAGSNSPPAGAVKIGRGAPRFGIGEYKRHADRRTGTGAQPVETDREGWAKRWRTMKARDETLKASQWPALLGFRLNPVSIGNNY
jgi:bifunctional UDP-N-acetylglucosamine pyrophosphorylase / glucosamine-1-phosphate N-acetyltransferase